MVVLKGSLARSGLLLWLLGLIIHASPSVAATSIEDPYYDLVRAAVLFIPLKGILLLGVISLISVLDRERAPEPPWFHISNILAVVALISFMEALYTPFAFLDTQNTTTSFAVLAVVSTLLLAFVFSRYLLFPVWVSGLVGALFAGLSILWWNYLLGLTAAQVDDVVGSLEYYFLAALFIFVCLLVLETLRHHHWPGRKDEGSRKDMDDLSVRERTLRMGEMLLAIVVLALVATYLWS